MFDNMQIGNDSTVNIYVGELQEEQEAYEEEDFTEPHIIENVQIKSLQTIAKKLGVPCEASEDDVIGIVDCFLSFLEAETLGMSILTSMAESIVRMKKNAQIVNSVNGARDDFMEELANASSILQSVFMLVTHLGNDSEEFITLFHDILTDIEQAVATAVEVMK